jgi:phenylpyruvate tautomerase PptA (4-oxalocrotonate tautomerase family)
MPILDVEIVQPDATPLDRDLPARLADAAAAVFSSAPMQTWVRLRLLPATQYAENAGGPPPGTWPVFVTVLKARLPAPDAMRDEIRRLTQQIAHVCQRPAEQVHVLYAPPAAGRAAFGGTLVEPED